MKTQALFAALLLAMLIGLGNAVAPTVIHDCATLSTSGVYVLEAEHLSPAGDCFRIAAKGVTLNCNNVPIAHAGADGDNGISNPYYDNFRAINCVFKSFAKGIRIGNGTRTLLYNSIESSDFTDNEIGIEVKRTAITITDTDSNKVILELVNLATLERNKFYGRPALTLLNSDKNVLRTNLFRSILPGIVVNLTGSSENRFENDSFVAVDKVIHFNLGSSENVFYNSTISDQIIEVKGASTENVFNNPITLNPAKLSVDATSGARVEYSVRAKVTTLIPTAIAGATTEFLSPIGTRLALLITDANGYTSFAKIPTYEKKARHRPL